MPEPVKSQQDEYQLSAAYVGALVRAFKERNLLSPQVMQRVSPKMGEVIEAPYSKGWIAAQEAETVSAAIAQIYGEQALEDAGLHAVKNSIAPIVKPLVSVFVAIFGLKPSTMFSNMNDIQRGSLKGVTTGWVSGGPGAGVLSVTYPVPTLRISSEPMWRASMRFVFETCNVKGTIEKAKIEGNTLRFACTWA